MITIPPMTWIMPLMIMNQKTLPLINHSIYGGDSVHGGASVPGGDSAPGGASILGGAASTPGDHGAGGAAGGSRLTIGRRQIM